MPEDDVKLEIEWLSREIEPPAPNLDEVMQGGRGLRRRRRVGIGMVAATAIAGMVVMVSNLPRLGIGREQPIAPVRQPTLQQSQVPNPRVATFAVRAVAQAGLLDPTGDFNDYQNAEPVGGAAAWFVSFETVICDPSITCQSNPDGDIQLRVEIQQGSLVVTEASGPMSEEARQKLLSYQEQPTPEDFGLEFPVVRIEETADEGLSIVASPLWRGPIPTPAATVECHVEVYDKNGAVIYQGPSRQEPKPETEAMRAGTQFIFGVPPESLDGEPARADVICRTL